MKIKNKILLLSLFLVMYTSCSKTETGVITAKKGWSVTVRPLDDTTMFREIDFTLVNMRDPHGIYETMILSGKHTYDMLKTNDTLTYKNNNERNFIIVNNWNQIRRINGMTPTDFLHNRTNTR